MEKLNTFNSVEGRRGWLASEQCVQGGMDNVFGVTVHVHPVALMAIVDSHERRAEGSKRAVGTLLGVKEKRGVVVIRNAYAVPHNETEELVSGLRPLSVCVAH